MDAAVSLHHHGALPLLASLPPPHHHHRALPLQPRRPSISSSSSKAPAARLTVAARPTSPARSAPAVPAAVAAHSSTRATTGYAAALADACIRAGTLRRASRHARALLFRHQSSSSSSEEEETAGRLDARVAAMVRMLVGKGKAGMVAEVMAEFAAICDQLLPLPARAHAD
ncbi:uncharacterized protein LOC133927390 [Phragmites australis]|uniref:uncharacterized protein LOC133927390 n=1 Tax=Phragmites australis TaxID=29695 RepID=UPI002D76F567|nr:uncharacterized protein LOC133927390 [Phragmites australis]